MPEDTVYVSMSVNKLELQISRQSVALGESYNSVGKTFLKKNAKLKTQLAEECARSDIACLKVKACIAIGLGVCIWSIRKRDPRYGKTQI